MKTVWGLSWVLLFLKGFAGWVFRGDCGIYWGLFEKNSMVYKFFNKNKGMFGLNCFDTNPRIVVMFLIFVDRLMKFLENFSRNLKILAKILNTCFFKSLDQKNSVLSKHKQKTPDLFPSLLFFPNRKFINQHKFNLYARFFCCLETWCRLDCKKEEDTVDRVTVLKSDVVNG